jgi:flagellar hook-associated protein 1 FlgK
MSNLLSALDASANALSVFQSALGVTSNNIANSSTPGYVEQTPQLEALPFDNATGIGGGVTSGPVQDARNIYAEEAVQGATTDLGTWQQMVSTLQPVQGTFDVTGQSGIPAALSQFYQAASTWSTNTGDSTDQQAVLNAAQGVARAFQQQSAEVSQATASADNQMTGLVGQVNSLTAQLQKDNVQLTQTGSSDPALQSNVYNTLQQLSQLVPITSFKQTDGSMTVLLGGQTPLVIGQTQYQLSSHVAVPAGATNPNGPPSAQVLDSSGKDITTQITGGQLGGVLQARNGVLAQLGGDSSQTGSINQLALAFADRVNTLLTSGNITDANPSTGATAVPGIVLFTYASTPGNATNIAQTLAVNPAITGSQLAAIDPGPPEVDNGVPLALANLATSTNSADQINGMNYAAFYGQIAGNVGSAISTAQNNQTTAQSMVTQTENLRQQSSGVDLNQEAVTIMQFQRAYDAAAKVVNVIDQLSQDVVNMIPSA